MSCCWIMPAAIRKSQNLNIGLVWTVCKAQHIGLAMSPGIPTRTLSWPGTLAGKTLAELAGWITDWEPYKATVAMAAINCSLNRYELPSGITLLPAPDSANLAVFDHFLPRLQGKKVVVVGRYPGIERYAEQINLSIIERQPAVIRLSRSRLRIFIARCRLGIFNGQFHYQ